MPKQRSQKQRRQAAFNLAKILATRRGQDFNENDLELENINPFKLQVDTLQREANKQRDRADKTAQKLRNRTKEAERAKRARDILREENRRVEKNMRMRYNREPLKRDRLISRALNNANLTPGTLFLKQKNVVKEESREMIRNLTALNIPEEKTDKVIGIVLNGFGFSKGDEVSARSVSRIAKEGGVAAQIQLVREVTEADGCTLSGDGTTIRHRNYESRHITLVQQSEERLVKTRFLGITSAPNHTSETQLQGLKNLRDRYYTTYNNSPLGQEKPEDSTKFATYLLGLGSDHAEDQKKLARLILEWKVVSQKELLGRRHMLSAPLEVLLPRILEASNQKIEDAGGHVAWSKLTASEKDRHDAEVYKKLSVEFGEEAWLNLTETEQNEAKLWVWAGCCMHKEMNAVKGGARAMAEFWTANEFTPPIRLMNRDNAAAVAAGPSAAHDRAMEVSEGGGVKLTSLAGAVFKHKNDKMGQQDTYKLFFEAEVGYTVQFPHTSHIRFGSHCAAAAELLVRLPLYLKFLLHIKDKKEKRNFNHMEKNVFNGLKDLPTLTELCVLALNCQAISHPYMRLVRGSGKQRMNAIDLGPLHTKVKAHCQKIISNPGLLLAPDASYETGTLDGSNWERPEAFFAIQYLKPNLPHLEGCLVAFFKGALEVWNRLTAEFCDDGDIAKIPSGSRSVVFINATNDHEEGGLGNWGQGTRRAPNITLEKWNAKTMYKKNDTSKYIRESLSAPQNLAFLRAEARKQDAQGIDRKTRREEVLFEQREVDAKRQKDIVRKAKEDAREAVLDGLAIEDDVDKVKKGLRKDGTRLTVEGMKLQLNWHRRHDTAVPSKTLVNKLKKDDILKLLIDAVERRCASGGAPIATPYVPTEDPDEDWEEQETRDEADLMDVDND